MGLYDELSADGRGGPLLVNTVHRLMAQIARSSSFPPPEGHSRWDDDAVSDAVGQLFADKPAFVTMGWALATDDRTLERVFLRTIKNFLIDQAKGTDTGKLRRRLRGLIDKDPAVAAGKLPTGEDAWWLADGPSEEWFGDVADLDRAASQVRGVRVTTLNPAGPTPAATVAALMAIVHAVLATAGGAVRAQGVTRVVERRFGLATRPVTRPLLDGELGKQFLEQDVAGADVAADVEAAAEAIWESLDATERSVCPHLLRSHVELETVLDMGPFETTATAEWLYAKMRLGCEDAANVDAIVARVMRMCAERQ